MAVVAPVITAIGGFLGAAAPIIGAVATGVSIYARIREAKYKQQVLNNQAQLLEREADEVRDTGQVVGIEQDLAAVEVMDEELAFQGASGFEVDSFSFRKRRLLQRKLARRDSLRIVNNAQRKAERLEQQAALDRQSGSFARRSGTFDAVGDFFGGVGDLISSADTVSSQRRRAVGGGGK